MARVAADDAPGGTAEFHAEYDRLDAQYRRELEHLAHLGYARDWAELADSALGWRPEPPATGRLLFVAPDLYVSENRQPSAADLSEEAQLWRESFDRARQEHADALFELAHRAADAGEASLAFVWATEAVRENPDHADARRVLGYELHDGQWLTPLGRRMKDNGRMWHPRFGWIAAEDEARYEAGERPLGSAWITAEEDARRRTDLESGWRVRTDHFLVTTNYSLEAAARLAAQLERLHQIWSQLFIDFYVDENEVQRLFAGQRQAGRGGRPFRVFYHRDRDQYVSELQRRQPRVGETLGIYFDTINEAHFFAGDDNVTPTLYHEAVHQLFHESRPAARDVGGTANFWIVEGVATFFETLTEHVDPHAGLYFTIGEATAGRMPAARGRLLGDNFYLPLEQLSQLGKEDLQRDPQIAKLYSQAAGLTAFLIDADRGRYRKSLARSLTAVYAGRDNPQTLARETGQTYAELDSQYRSYLESLP